MVHERRTDKTEQKKKKGGSKKINLQLVHRIDFSNKNKSREATTRELKDCQGKAAGSSIFNTPWVAQLIFFAEASAEFMGCSFPICSV